MKIEYGIHFYINICNYSQIIEYEENSTGKLNHCIHLLNTFFTSVERYSAKYKKIEIEKITGSRLHLYAVGDIDEVVDDVLDVICYAYSFSLEVNRISKYKTLPSIKINAGASYGKFITHNIELSDNKTEFTSIGYACNYAAKLQNIAKSNYLCLDDEIYNEIKYKVQCEKLYNAKFKKKYNQDYYYSLAIDKLNNNEYGDFIDIQIKNFNSNSLGDMEFTNTNSRFGFDNLSLNSGKKFDGIPVYADVRDFTSKFDEDDENLIEMAYRVIELLKTMYNIVDKCSGTHVQFQGDREFAVFVMDKNNVILKNVIIAGLRMIDAIDKTTIFSLGIGAVEGKLHATTIGIRNNKDNILLGKAVNEANYAEDELAEKKELVISDDIFEKLNVIDKKLASIFKMKARGYYYTTLGYSHYRNIVEKEELIQSTKNKLYNGAWS